MSNHDTKVLNSLIATTIDSADGYQAAAERASDDRLAPLFGRFATERRQTADRLKQEVRQAGGDPEDAGMLKAAAHRRWLDLKDSLGQGDRAVLDSVEAGETYIREKYEAALRDPQLSAGARNAVAAAFTTVAGGKAQVSELRRRCGLPEAEPGSSGGWGKVGLGIGALAAVAGVAIAARKRGSSHAAEGDEAFTLRLQTDENLRLISSKKVEGTPVIGRDGERLGKIDSVMVDKYSGRVGYAVMTFGGTLGVGESLFPLPWSVLTYDEDQGGYAIDLTAEDLANAPRFEPSDAPEFTPAYRQQILIFYRPGGQASKRSGDRGSSAREGGDGGRASASASSATGRQDGGFGGERLAAGGSGSGFGTPAGDRSLPAAAPTATGPEPRQTPPGYEGR